MADKTEDSNDDGKFIMPNMNFSDSSDDNSSSNNTHSSKSGDVKSEKDVVENVNFRGSNNKDNEHYSEFVYPESGQARFLEIKVQSPQDWESPQDEASPQDAESTQDEDLNSLPLPPAWMNPGAKVEYVPVSDTLHDEPQKSYNSRASSKELEPPYDLHFLSPHKTSSMGQSSRLDFAYLTAQPLVIDRDGLNKIQVLNSADEWKKIEKVIQKSEVNLRYEKAIATTENLQRVLNLGCRVLHLSGYGLQHRLIFEDEEKLGVAQVISTNSLQKLLDALITKQRWLELVVVSACHSYFAGKAFQDNGIKSVVCVKYDTSVDDKAAQTFSSSFYNSLFSLKELTVCNAFNGAKTRIEIQHSGQDKYMLLQKYKDHRVLWNRDTLSSIGTKNWENLSKKPSANCLPRNPQRVGREIEMELVLRQLNKSSQKRVVVVHSASKGSGKRAFALMLAHYLSERSTFAFHRIFFFEKTDLIVRKESRKRKHGRRRPISANFALQFLNKQTDWNPEQQRILHDFHKGKNWRQFMSQFARRFVKDQSWLIIIDHISEIGEKQLIELKKFLNDLLRACEGVKLLITCRYSKAVLLLFEQWSRFAYELPLLSLEESAMLFYQSLPSRYPPITFGYNQCKDVKSEIVSRLKNESYIQLMRGIPGLIKEEALQIQPPRRKKPKIVTNLERGLRDLKRIVQSIEIEPKTGREVRKFIEKAKKRWSERDHKVRQSETIFEYLIFKKCEISESEFKQKDRRLERGRNIPESYTTLPFEIQEEMLQVVNGILMDHVKERMMDLIDSRHLTHWNVGDFQLEEIYQYFRRDWIAATVFDVTSRIAKKAKKWYRKFDFHSHQLELTQDNPSIEKVLQTIKDLLKGEGIIKDREYGTYFEDYWYDKLYISFRDHPQLKNRLKSRTTMNAKDWKSKRKNLMDETIPIGNVRNFLFFYVEKNLPMYKALQKYIDQKDPIILYGFITRQQAEDLVRTCDKHTFIIRFSVRKEGLVLTVFEGKQGMTPYKHFQFNMEIPDSSANDEITFTSCRRSENNFDPPYRTNNFVKLVRELNECKYLYVSPPANEMDKNDPLFVNSSKYSKFYSASVENHNCWRIPKNLIFTDNPECYPA